MKIRGALEVNRKPFSEQLDQEKRRQHAQQDAQQGGPAEHENIEVTEEAVGNAIDAFSKDSQTQASGISATAEGHGPGLKVVLKDGQGRVVRQLTGEEFLKLRDAVERSADKNSHARGKILDQKL